MVAVQRAENNPFALIIRSREAAGCNLKLRRLSKHPLKLENSQKSSGLLSVNIRGRLGLRVGLYHPVTSNTSEALRAHFTL